MKKTFFMALFVGAGAVSAFAQQAPTANPGGDTPAVMTPDTKNPTAPVEGANSFTEAQAKKRMEESGYTGITGLTKNDKGVWMASGMKDGKTVAIALDYQGNVVAR